MSIVWAITGFLSEVCILPFTILAALLYLGVVIVERVYLFLTHQPYQE